MPIDLPLTEKPAWHALEEHARLLKPKHLRDLFAADPKRGERLCAEGAGLFFDYSKNRVTDETIGLLVRLARECGVEARRDAMFRGDRINVTENRPVLHTALRAPQGACVCVDGTNVVPAVYQVLERMGQFCERIRSGDWRGHSGRPIRNIVNIGIGGSSLGPQMAHQALRAFVDPRLTFRFVANVDGSEFSRAVAGLDPEETLFIVASKTFTTQETMANAAAARRWIAGHFDSEEAVGRHFVAVSTNLDAVAAFGIDPEHAFGFWDWVGGRYSLTSAIGLSTMLAIGPKRFRELLDGFHAMDEHFRAASLTENLPVLHALLTVWYVNFFAVAAIGVMPYSADLGRFPAYLQQLQMESNGKQVDLSGQPVACQTGPVIWGEPGSDAQHSFYQLLHQGTRLIPCDLIGFARPLSRLRHQHDLLMANLFAQSEALAFGRSAADLAAEGADPRQIPWRVCPGNRPTTTILAHRLDPATLGSLIALYEHSVFVQGVIWSIDSFDQWGVELGKQLAGRIIPELESERLPQLAHDSSTNHLIRLYRKWRGPVSDEP